MADWCNGHCREGLWVHGNLLGTLPDAIGDCGSLRNLMLAGGLTLVQVSAQPEPFCHRFVTDTPLSSSHKKCLRWAEKWSSARLCVLAGNRLCTLPDSIAQLSNLDELNVPVGPDEQFHLRHDSPITSTNDGLNRSR